MFGKKFRKKPAIVEPYYVEILPGELDLKNTIIKEAIESSGELNEHWPKATLEELHQFTQSLKQYYVIASGQKIAMKQFRYILNDKDEGPYPVGLTWNNPVIDLNFDNFVVQTAMSTFNDRETRLDESIEYNDIKTAISQLIQFSKDLTKIEQEDFPVLPTKDQYNNALKNDSDLRITPAKLIPKTTGGNNKPNVKPRKKPKIPVKSTPQQSLKPVENKQQNKTIREMGSKNIDNGNRKHISNNNINHVGKDVAKHASNNIVNDDVKYSVENIINNILAKIYLKVPQFENNVSKSNDSSYVEKALSNRKNDANIFINSVATELLDATKSNLLSEEGIKKLYQDYKKQVSELTDSNWQDPVLNEIKNKIESKYKDLIKTELESLQHQYQHAISAENRRHEDELIKLESEKNANDRNAENRLSNLKSTEIAQESSNALATMRQKIDVSLSNLEKSFIDELSIYINSKAYVLNKDNLETLNKIYEELQFQLTFDESNLSKEYVKTLAAETKLAQERKSLKNVDEIENKLLNFQKQNNLLEQAATNAKKELSAKDMELKTISARLDGANEEVVRANNRLADLTSEKNQSFNQTMLASVISQSKPSLEDNSNSNSNGFMKGILVSVVMIVVFGVMGFTAFKINQANVRADKATAAVSSTQKQLEASKNSLASSKPRSTESTEAYKDTSGSKDDTYFKDLDLSIGMNSLITYDHYYKNIDLKTNERVLAVGKLLIANNRTQDALNLANVNQGHNQDLLQYVAKLSSGSK